MASNANTVVTKIIAVVIVIAVLVALIPTVIVFLGNLTTAMSTTSLAVLFSAPILTLLLAVYVWKQISGGFSGGRGGY